MATTGLNLSIPSSNSTVTVSLIDTTSKLRGIPVGPFLQPTHAGHEYMAVPCYSFLIQNHALGRTIVFDLGVRKDFENLSPGVQKSVEQMKAHFEVKQDVCEILEQGGVDIKTIEAVVWSHWHFDHTGDPSTFEPSTALIVGPGFRDNLLPGYPQDPDSPILESDYAGRELRELSFVDSKIKIGNFAALDYFGDGSFYFLDAPGHAIGHINALARVTSDPDPPSFVLMGADSCHHAGELRPSPYLPLPDTIEPNPFCPNAARPSESKCFGAIFEPLLSRGKSKPFYELAENGIHPDPKEGARTIEKLQEADVAENVFVIAAHDEYLLDTIDFFPKTLNDFMRRGWKLDNRWRFLKDFSQAIGWTGTLEPKRDWHNPEL